MATSAAALETATASERPAASNDYRLLKARVDEVLRTASRGSAARAIEWRMRRFMVLQICQFLVLLYAPWWWLKLISAGVFALYRARTVWTIIHERVHRAELPTTVAKVFYDFSTVYVVRFWRGHHLRHHAHTNTEDDPDTRMFFGRDMNDARKPSPGPAKRAARFVTTLAQYPFLFVLFLLRSIVTYKGGNAVLYLATIVVYGVAISLLLPRDMARLNALANFSIGALYVLFTFAPTHTASKANFQLSNDPLRDQLVATNDVWPRSRLWSLLCGGINLHIEHHLFPYVPFGDLPLVAPVVESFARERGLPYNAYSPVGLWRAHLGFLWRS